MNPFAMQSMDPANPLLEPWMAQAIQQAQQLNLIKNLMAMSAPEVPELPAPPERPAAFPQMKPWQKGLAIGADVASMLATIMENRKRRDRYMPTRRVPTPTAFPGMMQVGRQREQRDYQTQMDEYQRQMAQTQMEFQNLSNWARGEQAFRNIMAQPIASRAMRKTPEEIETEAKARATGHWAGTPESKKERPPTATETRMAEIERIFKEGGERTKLGQAQLRALGVPEEEQQLLQDKQANAIFKIVLQEATRYGYEDPITRGMNAVKMWNRHQLKIPLGNFFQEYNQLSDQQARQDLRDEFIAQFKLDPLELWTNY